MIEQKIYKLLRISKALLVNTNSGDGCCFLISKNKIIGRVFSKGYTIPSPKVELWVSGVLISSQTPNKKIKFGGKRYNDGFRFNFDNNLCRFIKKPDDIKILYKQKELPVNNYRVSAWKSANREPVSILKDLISDGFTLWDSGIFAKPIELNLNENKSNFQKMFNNIRMITKSRVVFSGKLCASFQKNHQGKVKLDREVIEIILIDESLDTKKSKNRLLFVWKELLQQGVDVRLAKSRKSLLVHQFGFWFEIYYSWFDEGYLKCSSGDIWKSGSYSIETFKTDLIHQEGLEYLSTHESNIFTALHRDKKLAILSISRAESRFVRNIVGDIGASEKPRLNKKGNFIPLIYWNNTTNFGDLLSPWLISRLYDCEVTLAKRDEENLLGIGSIIKRAGDSSLVWGSGAFGDEDLNMLNRKAHYLAVRGPLTRNKLRMAGLKCPEVYGDPALLIPKFFKASEKKYELGVVLRWSEGVLIDSLAEKGIKIIDLDTDNIELTLSEITACHNILTTSLHGLIIADAYGIPNAWLDSVTPRGLHFKFYDYFLSVDKVRKPQILDLLNEDIDTKYILTTLDFDSRKIRYDEKPLLDALPKLY